jgi:hypothetical protein
MKRLRTKNIWTDVYIYHKTVYTEGVHPLKNSVLCGGPYRLCYTQTYINNTSYIICPTHGKYGMEIVCGSCSLECSSFKSALPFIVPSFSSVLHAISRIVYHRYRI